jgi:uncharacterized protein
MMEALDVRDLLGRPGTSRPVRLERTFDDLATDLVRVGGPVAMDLRLESVVEGIFVTGSLSGLRTASCARCLEPVESGFDLRVGELFALDPDDDEYPVEDGEIGLEPMVRDAVVLAMPFAPLCRPDCRGLCERCGGNRNRDGCSCPPRVDPRWAALQELKLD